MLKAVHLRQKIQMHTPIASVLACGLVVACSNLAVAQPLTYNVVEIPQPPQGSYYYGEVFGSLAAGMRTINNLERAVVYGAQGVSVLDSLNGYSARSYAHNGNLQNDFVGNSSGSQSGTVSTVWLDGVATNANTWDNREVWISDVNESRVFSGSAVIGNRYEAITVTAEGAVSFLDTPDDTTSSSAGPINDSGDIAGIRFRPGIGWVVCRWQNGMHTDLQMPPALPNATPLVTTDFMNSSGAILGNHRYLIDPANPVNGLYLWNNIDYVQVADQGQFGNTVRAIGLSDNGLVAYERSFTSYLWYDGVTYTADQLILNNFSGYAYSILTLGTNGTMFARVSDASGDRIAMLIPVPSPTVTSVLFAGVSLTMSRRRKSCV